MWSGFSYLRRNRDACAWLVSAIVLGFILRALVPAGFMPATAQGEPFELVICTGFGLKTLSGDAKAPVDTGDRQHSSTAPCHFSALGPMAPAGDGGFAVMAFTLQGPVDAPAVDPAPPRGFWPMAGTPRAPPFAA